MSQPLERRAEPTHRIPFDATVELGNPSGESFEARAVDLSGDGMHLRTAYLPEVGQPLSCTFDAGEGAMVGVGAEVVWRREQGSGGEFGIQFVNVDEDQARALAQLLDRGSNELPPPAAGARVRLHIEGLAGPMRGVVKHPSERKLVVGSEIAFLQLGRDLQIEEKETGHKRPARIDRVDVELDPASKTPHLVISLVYTSDGKSVIPPGDLTDPTPQRPVEVEADWSKYARESLERVRPLIGTVATRVRTFARAVGDRSERRAAAKLEVPALRTTAPPPLGPLRAEGKRVVRGDEEGHPAREALAGLTSLPAGRRGMIVAAAMGGMLVVGSLALRTSDPIPEPASQADVAPAAAVELAAGEPAPAGAAQVVAARAVEGVPVEGAPVEGAVPGSALSAVHAAAPPAAQEFARREPSVFGNPDVRRGNVLRLRLDGPVERILGASEPTGFTVVVPGRKSLEVAAPLAEKDERIASIRVTNVASGAELSVVFKDGVPKYLVRGHGDELELVLAQKGEASSAPSGAKAPANEVAARGAGAKATHGAHAPHAAHAAHKKKARKHHD